MHSNTIAKYLDLLFQFFIQEFLSTAYVSRVPTALLCVGLMVLGFLSFACGLILDSMSNQRRENLRLHYLRN